MISVIIYELGAIELQRTLVLLKLYINVAVHLSITSNDTIWMTNGLKHCHECASTISSIVLGHWHMSICYTVLWAHLKAPF